MKTKNARLPYLHKGAQLQTKELFLYGRFETMMKPAYGSGVVSSFFTFNDKPGFQDSWNEIDFEFLGRNTNQVDTNAIRTQGGYTDKNINVVQKVLNKRSSDNFWKLCIEWAPTHIQWKVNDIIIRSMNIVLNKPQKLMMNIWVGSTNWAGEFNSGIAPQRATYSYVRYDSFNDGKFIPQWQDDFKKIESRWYIANHKLGDTQLVNENVSVNANGLTLSLK